MRRYFFKKLSVTGVRLPFLFYIQLPVAAGFAKFVINSRIIATDPGIFLMQYLPGLVVNG